MLGKENHMADNGDSSAEALGRKTSGLFVVTARCGEQETGMLASWVQQCSFDPPQVSVAVRKGRYILDWLTEDTPFAVAVIPEDGKALISHFGRGFEPGQPAFEGLDLLREGSFPAVPATAHAYLHCRVVTRVDAGDHVLVIGRVHGGAVLHHGGPIVHVRKNGLKY
jgi:flavin reductase (DIM6/NTAB) family NADH-FMN oxidoreductase RutF